MGMEGGQPGVPEKEIPEDEKKRIVSALIKMMELGIGAVYGDEDAGMPEAAVDCQGMLGQCHARCCKLNFALTRDEAALGLIRHNPSRPFLSPATMTVTAPIWTAKATPALSTITVPFAAGGMIVEGVIISHDMNGPRH